MHAWNDSTHDHDCTYLLAIIDILKCLSVALENLLFKRKWIQFVGVAPLGLKWDSNRAKQLLKYEH